MNFLKLHLILMVFLWNSTVLSAESAESFIGVEFGKAKFSGDLTNNEEETFIGMNLMIGGGKKSGSNVFGFFNLPFRSIEAQGVLSDFPFEAGSIKISQNGVVPNICYAVGSDLAGCMGFGYTVLRVSDKDRLNEQSYGAPTIEVHLGKFSGEGLVGGLNASYTQVEQIANKQKSKFTIIPVSMFLGYNFVR